jgi:hypothetical protein
MGFWYFLSIAVGVALYVKFTFFNKAVDRKANWKKALSVQFPIVGLGLIGFGVFMLTPMGTKLVDLLFS